MVFEILTLNTSPWTDITLPLPTGAAASSSREGPACVVGGQSTLRGNRG